MYRSLSHLYLNICNIKFSIEINIYFIIFLFYPFIIAKRIKHEEELKNTLFNINVDMTGTLLGFEIAVCSCEEAVAKYIDILGINVPSTTVPVKPGRKLAIIIEIAAMNNRQKKLGYNAAKELMAQLGMGEVETQPKELDAWH